VEFTKRVLRLFVLGIFLFLTSCQNEPDPNVNIDEQYPENGDQALQWLLEGNERFVTGKSRHRRENAQWRARLTEKQLPYTTILGCSDSRVPTELLFDQGFGDLFIIRVAGNVVGEDELGSIEYAVFHLHTGELKIAGAVYDLDSGKVEVIE
jgi:carbonic anhydrase